MTGSSCSGVPNLATRKVASGLLIVFVFLLFGLSVVESYRSGQHLSMYDNPIYRWRESLSVALSQLRDPPLHGYLAYRSIRDFFATSGLGLMNGEADPLPTSQQRAALVFDGPKIERLIQDASHVQVNANLPPVTINGNEKGLADFYYIAFKLFGINIEGFVKLYYCALLLSVIAFLIAFRSSQFCIYLLGLYLIAHISMVHYANNPHFFTVHNSRFFPVLGVLPAMHLLLSVLRQERFTLVRGVAAAVQIFLLCFVISIRTQATWEALVVIFAPILVSSRSWLSHFNCSQLSRKRLELFIPGWPAIFMFVGAVTLALYIKTVPDQKYYRGETATHNFWDPVYEGTVSASPVLSELYLYNGTKYGDGLPCVVAFHGLGDERDKLICSNPMVNTAAYDDLARRMFFKILQKHPFLVMKSFLWDKPIEQVRKLNEVHIFSPTNFLISLALGLVLAISAALASKRANRGSEIVWTVAAIVFTLLFSSITTFITPSIYIIETIMVWYMVALLGITQLVLRVIQHFCSVKGGE